MKEAAKVVQATRAPRERVAQSHSETVSNHMMQGGTGRKGDAAKAGNTASLMGQGNSPKAALPTGKVRSTMHQ